MRINTSVKVNKKSKQHFYLHSILPLGLHSFMHSQCPFNEESLNSYPYHLDGSIASASFKGRSPFLGANSVAPLYPHSQKDNPNAPMLVFLPTGPSCKHSVVRVDVSRPSCILFGKSLRKNGSVFLNTSNPLSRQRTYE